MPIELDLDNRVKGTFSDVGFKKAEKKLHPDTNEELLVLTRQIDGDGLVRLLDEVIEQSEQVREWIQRLFGEDSYRKKVNVPQNESSWQLGLDLPLNPDLEQLMTSLYNREGPGRMQTAANLERTILRCSTSDCEGVFRIVREKIRALKKIMDGS